MRKLLEKIYRRALDIGNEEKKFKQMVGSLVLGSHHKILDVGCGYGRNILLLRSMGFDALGVDANTAIVQSNFANGLNCVSVEEFEKSSQTYDLIIMSHVVEHFQPADLLVFIDNYLDRLKNGGYLLIATPLMSPYFYDDFDHVKPYHPTGFNMVFAKRADQVQYYSRNTIELVDIWFRRSPFKDTFSRGSYISKGRTSSAILSFLFALLFRLSFGMVGNKDGWMGLYKKTG